MPKNWKTKLIHSDVRVPEGFRSLSLPVFRGSTVLFPNAGVVDDHWNQYEVGYTYGLYGTPTALELAGRVCELEQGSRTILAPGGQAAISLINFSFLKAGDHILVPESIYGPNRKFAGQVLRRFGVEVTFYPPTIGQESGRGRPPSTGTSSASASGIARTPDQIPIRSAARGGTDQEMFLEDGPIGYTPRPASLAGVRSAYAIYMVGDSMEPRYEPGWLLHVNPFKPPTRGRDVVVYKTGQAVLIKQFVRWEGDALVLRQLNPSEELRIPRDEVLECHLVVGVDQEG